MTNKINDLRTIFLAAKNYESNLLNKNILVIYEDRKTKKYLKEEFIFFDLNFLHLTGVEYTKSTNKNKNSAQFFYQCLANELKIEDFSYKKDGSTRLKIEVLNNIVSVHKEATMIGNFNKSRITLFTDKICGSVRACMGAVKNDNNYYVPNTALKEDVRRLVDEWYPIRAIYIKSIKDKKYSILSRVSKDYDSSKLSKEIALLIEL